VQAVQHALIRGWWGVEADRHHDFDTLEHAWLLSLVARRSRDRRVLKRIRQGLNAGGVEQGPWQPTAVGSPPGGVSSPVVATMYGHVLAMYGVTRDAGLGELVR
jgi:retron-type reverse transcriptase